MKHAEEDGTIAIIGLALRFPGDASSMEEFWKLVESGNDTRSDIPSDRMNIAALQTSHKDVIEGLPVNGGHFLKGDVGAFDAPFFKITTSEAAAIDPQQRSLLEVTYHALENAGISLEAASGSNTSVHVGCSSSDYATFHARDPLLSSRHSATGGATAYLANRLSWFYDLTGPSMNTDTACSSSLHALSLGYEGLLRHHSDMAIVAGSNLILDPSLYRSLISTNACSPDGLSRSFDATANGYGRSEGYGVVILKRVSDAIRNGDPIRAVVRAAASNQDGRTPFITQPSQSSQETLIKEVYAGAGLDIADTTYYEAHATGTPVGDPIEINAVASVLKGRHSITQDLYLGSVKANIGHLEGCSGIASLIKVVLMLEKGVIPPIAGLHQLNPRIKRIPNLKFPTEAHPWVASGPRRASINSFGIGGANCHAILDDAESYVASFETKNLLTSTSLITANCNQIPSQGMQHSFRTNKSLRDVAGERKERLIFLSAADQDGIKRIVKSYQSFWDVSRATFDEVQYLANLEYTLSLCRSWLPWRSYAVINSFGQLQRFEDLLSTAYKPVPNLNLIYAFTGQGSQWVGMGRALIGYPAFRGSIEEAERYLVTLGCQWSLPEELCLYSGRISMEDPALSQTLTTVLQVALVELLRSFNVHPSIVVGHSSGEIAAAFAAGLISRACAWRIAFYRGTLASQLLQSPGSSATMAMLSVALSEEEALSRIASISPLNGNYQNLTVACINSQTSVTISGASYLIDALKEQLDTDSIFARKLRVPVAYHSEYMKAIAHKYEAAIGSLEADVNGEETCVMISSVTEGKVDREAVCQPQYWVRNLLSPVKFWQALRKALAEHTTSSIVLEVGPHRALEAPIQDTMAASPKHQHFYVPLLKRQVSATFTILQAMGRLWCLGVKYDLNRVLRFDESQDRNLSVLTDLPSYPFDHSKSYWQEGPLNRSYRLQRYPRNELLGSPVPDWNSLEPRWMNLLNRSDIPWVAGHMINRQVLLPGAGMLVMAIEAAKQHADSDHSIAAFSFHDVSFLSPINLSNENASIETQVALKPDEMRSAQIKKCFRFTVDTHSSKKWHRNCEGFISVEHPERVDDINKRQTKTVASSAHRTQYDHAIDVCRETSEHDKMYNSFDASGYNYTFPFDLLQGVLSSDDNQAIADLQLSCPEGYKDSGHVIHPAVLDCLFQMSLVSSSQGGNRKIAPAVATGIKSMHIRVPLVQGENDGGGLGAVKLYARSVEQNNACDIVAIRDGRKETVITVDGFQVTSVGGQTSSEPVEKHVNMSYRRIWKPDVQHLKGKDLLDYCQNGLRNSETDPIELTRTMQFVTLGFIQRTLAKLNFENEEMLQPHIRKHIAWMRQKWDAFEKDMLPETETAWKEQIFDQGLFEESVQRVLKSGAKGKLYIEFGQAQADFMRGIKDPLETLFSGTLASNYYREGFVDSQYMRSLPRYLDLLGHKYPDMKILEIGAGTGGLTAALLEELGGDVDNNFTPRFATFDFTDVAPSFLPEVADRFRTWSNRMTFKTLDIDNDPCQQGFQKNSYDLVFAASVLHATKDLNITVRNIRKLLKPCGKLVIIEITGDNKLAMPFSFGTVPGWWASTDTREQGPCVSTEIWGRIFEANGFSGIDAVLPDYETPECRETSVCITTAFEPARPKKRHEILILNRLQQEQDEDSSEMQALHRALCWSDGTCFSPRINGELSSESLDSKPVVVLDCRASSILGILSETQFDFLKTLLSSSPAVLWVTREPSADIGAHGMVEGLARTLRNERENFRFLTLSVCAEQPLDKFVASITDVFEELINVSNERQETELRADHRGLSIPRYESYLVVDRVLAASSMPTVTKWAKMSEINGAKVAIKHPGLLDSLYFTQGAVTSQSMGDDEVCLEVKAAGLNFKDVLTALGRAKNEGFGIEVAGVVQQVGSNVGNLNVGDKVMGLGQNAFQMSLKCSTDSIVRIPDHLSFHEAAAMPVAFVTAYFSLHRVARLQVGETILIHAAAGGTGQAAVQVAQHLGAEVFATVGSTSKKQLLIEQYKIPEDHIFYSRHRSFAEGLKRMLAHRGGADVILNSVAGDLLLASWECMAPFGRFVEIGKRDIVQRRELPMDMFENNVSFHAVDIAHLLKHKPKTLKSILEDVVGLIDRRVLLPARPITTYKISRLEQAMRNMQSGNTLGKLVLDMDDDTIVEVDMKNEPSWNFEETATYMICGGFGGIGRELARWMKQRGARNLAIISRSGPSNDEARDLLLELSGAGVNVYAPHCDITSKRQLQAAVDHIHTTMPPLRGCIQATAVLRDSLFFNMTHAYWNEAVAPKVTATRNLHDLLPPTLTFLVILSSTSGVIGNQGQLNYAAGNTYQDALATYRSTRLGLKTYSINLTLVDDINSTAVSPAAAARLRDAGKVLPLKIRGLKALLDIYCDPAIDLPNAEQCQPILGIDAPANVKAKRLEPSHFLSEPAWSQLWQIAPSPALRPFAAAAAAATISSPEDYSAAFRAASDENEAATVVSDMLVKKLARSLGTPEENIDRGQPLFEYGMDSLLAVEVRNSIQRAFGVDMPVFEILSDQATFNNLGKNVAKRQWEDK